MWTSDLDGQIRLVQHWLAEAHLLALAPGSSHSCPLLHPSDLQQQEMHFETSILPALLPADYKVAPSKAAVNLCRPVTKKQQRLQQAAL